MRKKNRPQQTGQAFIKSQRGAPNTPRQIRKLEAHGCGKAWSLRREGGGKKAHWVAGPRKGEQVSGWVKHVILQVLQWFRERNFEVASRWGYSSLL
jgi:hypothetical protein